MPRLPSANDLGRVSLRPATGVASPDLSAPFRAAQQLGNQVTQIAGEVADDQNRLDFGNAQAAYSKAYADVRESFRNDNDYATMPERYGEQMQKVVESTSAAISSPRTRQLFDTWAQQQNTNGLSGIRDLAWGKEKDAGRATIFQNSENLSNTYKSSTDPVQRQQALDAMNNMLEGGVTKGYIDQTERQQWAQKWITNTAVGSLNMMQPEQRLSALRNPQGITTFLPPDQRQAMIKDAAQEAISTRVGQWQVQASTGNAGMNTLAVPHDTLMQAVYLQESGNRHLNADGSIVQGPVTKSGDRAQGVGQIMPATGRDPGFGIKPLQNDSEQENRRVSGELMDALTKRYNGNQVLALAAYNAGFRKVDNWIKQIGDPRTGQVSNEQFAASIPVNETRNYVYSISANAQRMGNVRSIIDSQDFKDMDGQQQAQMTSKILQVQDQIDSAYRVNIQQRITDDAARAQSGINIESPVTEAEFIRSIPSSATPGERAQFYQQWNRYKDTLALQPVNNFVMQNSAADGLAAVQALKPADNAADFQFKAQQYAQAQQNYQRVVAARESDPGGWLAQNSDPVKNAYQAYLNDPTQGANYIQAVIAEKRRLGIRSNDVLPDAAASSIAAQADGGDMKFSDLKAIADGFGQYSDNVIAQIQKKSKSAVRVAVAVNDPNAADTLFTIRNVKTDELKKNAGEQAKNVEAAWNSLAADISPTFSMQRRGGPETLADLNEQGKRLAYYYMANGEDAQAAAKKAYTKMIGDHYTVSDTWRIPNSLRLKEVNVTDGLRNVVNSLKAGDIGSRSIFYNPSMNEEQNAANNLAQIKNSAEWVTDENEQGVYLTVSGTYVQDPSGLPIHVSFVDASKSGIAKPSTTGSVVNWMSEKRKVTPPSEFYTPNVNATMADAFRVIQGQDATSPRTQKEPDNPSNTLRDALSRKGGN
ncbi:TPA: transglycosylase SLT domain-containing protein [Klebsiella michiganensis]